MDDFSSYSRRSRIPNEDTIYLYSKIEETLKNQMKPVVDAQNELQSTYNNLDNIINEVVSQNE